LDTSVLFKDDKTTIVLTEKLRPESTSSITLGYVDNVEFDAHENEAAKEL
jgi:hypothetical protein